MNSDKTINIDKLIPAWVKKRIRDTSEGLVNMPAYQPCPECRRNGKRKKKLPNAAIYWCRAHGDFVVGRGVAK